VVYLFTNYVLFISFTERRAVTRRQRFVCTEYVFRSVGFRLDQHVAVARWLRDTGNLAPRVEGRGPQRQGRTLHAGEGILDITDEDPGKSACSTGRQGGVSRTVGAACVCVSRSAGAAPGRGRIFRWREFFERLLLQCARKYNFAAKIVTDWACYTLTAV
jgi:hypothetical protein